jgi:hypothetical protein
MSNDLTQNNYELADTSLFKDDKHTGFEGTTGDTFKTPFLRVLQGLSPELSKSNAKYIEGAKIGQLCNSATQECYDTLDIIILKVEHSLLVWKPNRGGFVGKYPKSEESVIVREADGVQKWDSSGNEIVDTIEFFCVNIDDPMDIFILPLSSASLKHGKSFATRLRRLKVNGKPINVSWAGVWNIKTTEESNDKGSWHTIGNTPEFLRFITKEEKENIITPAIELLEKAETDYSTIEGESTISVDEVEY